MRGTGTGKGVLLAAARLCPLRHGVGQIELFISATRRTERVGTLSCGAGERSMP